MVQAIVQFRERSERVIWVDAESLPRRIGERGVERAESLGGFRRQRSLSGGSQTSGFPRREQRFHKLRLGGPALGFSRGQIQVRGFPAHFLCRGNLQFVFRFARGSAGRHGKRQPFTARRHGDSLNIIFRQRNRAARSQFFPCAFFASACRGCLHPGPSRLTPRTLTSNPNATHRAILLAALGATATDSHQRARRRRIGPFARGRCRSPRARFGVPGKQRGGKGIELPGGFRQPDPAPRGRVARDPGHRSERRLAQRFNSACGRIPFGGFDADCLWRLRRCRRRPFTFRIRHSQPRHRRSEMQIF